MIITVLSLMLAVQPQESVADTINRLQKMSPDQKVTVIDKHDKAKAKAAGVTTTASEVAQTLKTDPPMVSLNGNSGTGGGADSSVTAKTEINGPQVGRIVLSIITLVCLIGAVISVIRKWRLPTAPIVLGIAGIVSGIGIIFPTFAQIILGILVIAFVIDNLFSSKLASSLLSMGEGVVHGIAEAEKPEAGAEANAAVKLIKKNFIKAQVNAKDKSMIDKLRAAAGYSV